jgi:hypothetical protein
MFCFCLCQKKIQVVLFVQGKKIPQNSKTSDQPPKSHSFGGNGMREGRVWGGGLFLKVVHLPQIWVSVEEGEEGE